jgi:hypothetical protein
LYHIFLNLKSVPLKKIKKNDVGRLCSTDGVDEKFNMKERVVLINECKLEDNIKIDIK